MYNHVLAPDAKVITPYGATEAMPLTLIDGHEILEQTAALTETGKGLCVGNPLPDITLKVIKATDEAIPTWDNNLELNPGYIGEIVVKGPIVTRTYLNRPRQTALAKITEGDAVWHRMGDVGYFDNQGRLWFCGRKKHRVFTDQGILYPVQCETIFNRHPDVFRSAVVGTGAACNQRPILVVECKENQHPTNLLDQQRMIMELLALGVEYSHTRHIQDILFYDGSFPTDVRHNVKIQREKLAIWAAEQLHLPQPRGSTQEQRHTQDSEVSYTGKLNRGVLPAVFGALSLVLGIVASVLLLRKTRKSNGKTIASTEKK
ncbi:MAG: hypothetical protein E4H27_09180 [Anaerolineales bacterium]|nr:MAG: hypothetical protein E4H27_09180 [Anaerolineales bacterium]